MIMLAKEFGLSSMREVEKDKGEAWAQPKIDGIRALARLNEEGNVELVSRQDNRFLTVPHIEEALMPFFHDPMVYRKNIVLDGELYTHSLKDDFPRICSYIKKKHVTPYDLVLSSTVEYWIFDYYHRPLTPTPYSQRKFALRNWFSTYPLEKPLREVRTVQVRSGEECSTLANLFIEQGFEGAMIRLDLPYEFGRSKGLMKLKPFKDVAMTVVDVLEGAGKCSGMAGTLRCITPWGKEVNVTPGGFFDFRKEMWIEREKWIGREVSVKYQKVLPSGDVRHAVMVLDYSWDE